MEPAIPMSWIIGGLVCLGVAFLVALGISLYLAYFMYSDANARGQNGLLWALIGFFGGILALVIWLLIRPEKRKV